MTTVAGTRGPVWAPATQLDSVASDPLGVDANGVLRLRGTGSESDQLIGLEYSIPVATQIASKSSWSHPVGLDAANDPSTFDAAGNLYVVTGGDYDQDTGVWTNHNIRKITPAGVETTVAGNGDKANAPSTSAPALSGPLAVVTALAVDGSGNLYFAEAGWPYVTSERIRKVTAGGTISTVVSDFDVPDNSAAGPHGVDNDLAADAWLADLQHLLVGSTGVLYWDQAAGTILWRLGSDGRVHHVAGKDYQQVSTGDEGPAVDADFEAMSDLAAGPGGTLYVVDAGVAIRKIGTDGVIHHVAGTGNPEREYSGDGGPAATAGLGAAGQVAADAIGNVYFTSVAQGTAIRKISTNGTITRFAGSYVKSGDGAVGEVGDGQQATIAPLDSVQALVGAPGGGVLIGDNFQERIRKVGSDGVINTVVGGPAPGEGVLPYGVATAPNGDIAWVGGNAMYVRDHVTGATRHVYGEDIPCNSFPPNNWYGPAAITYGPDGLAYVATAGIDFYSCSVADVVHLDSSKVYRVNADDTVTLVAGDGGTGTTGDGGPATDAQLGIPSALAFDPDGNLLLADSKGNRVRKIDLATNKITTLAGTGASGTPAAANGDGGPATAAQIGAPSGLAVTSLGEVFVSELSNNRVRRINPDGKITSVAGTGQPGSTGDGGAPLSATLQGPNALALDASGTYLYVGDRRLVLGDPARSTSYQNHLVRRFDLPTPTVPGRPTAASAVAGDGTATVTWAAPAASGGSAITGYRITPYKSGVAQTPVAVGAVTSTPVTGLTNGAPYTFRVAAINAQGSGWPSLPSASVTPHGATATVPGVPTGVSAVAGNGQVTVSWTVPSSNGGSAITSYVVTPYVGAAAQPSVASSGTGTSKVIGGLVNGTAYSFKVAAVNSVGTGAQSAASNVVTPVAAATVPGVPTGVSAVAGNGQVTVSWTVPSSNGGSAITSYVVTPYVGAAAQPSVVSSGTGTSKVIGGLVNGTAYSFKVAAVNSVGTGAQSAASNVATPVAPVAPYAPFGSWSAFVNRQYVDLTTHAPSASELSTWVSQLSSGSKAKGDLDAALRTGDENLANVDPVVRVYRAFLGRAPDAGGLRFWIKRRRNVAPNRTWTVTQIATEFTASDEFINKYGTLTNRQFVTRIYTDVLGRAADQGGVDYWTAKLDSKKKTKAQVMVGFSESHEYQVKQKENTDVAIAYVYLLGRAPTGAETTDWTTREKAGTATHAQLLTELLNTTAYATHITG